MIGLRFRLFPSGGHELGEFVTAVPNWDPGDSLITGEGRRFRIIGLIPLDEPDSPYAGFFEVEPVEKPSGGA